MANEEQLAVLKRGVAAWNQWRASNQSAHIDLSEANLTSSDFTGVQLRNAYLASANLTAVNLTDADLRGADLTEANLNDATVVGAYLDDANLSRTLLCDANLTGANLQHAFLNFSNLTRANLTRANLNLANLSVAILLRAGLSHAKLAGADLTRADLTDADLTRADMRNARLNRTILAHVNLQFVTLAETVLANVDLSQTRGLDLIRHSGPSILDHRTLSKSGSLPLEFLRGCGLPDSLIQNVPSLVNAGPAQFHSCFISYSTANEDFAKRLHADLQARGIRCWFAPHDMRPGRKLHEQIDEAIRGYDRLLLVLSKESMSSRWVRTEIERARRKELDSNRQVLFPVALVPYSDIRAWEQINPDLGENTAREIREYFIPDFRDWKVNHDTYQQSFEKVVVALTSIDSIGTPSA